MFIVLNFTSLKIEDQYWVKKLSMDLYLNRYSGRGVDLLVSKGIGLDLKLAKWTLKVP